MVELCQLPQLSTLSSPNFLSHHTTFWLAAIEQKILRLSGDFRCTHSPWADRLSSASPFLWFACLVWQRLAVFLAYANAAKTQNSFSFEKLCKQDDYLRVGKVSFFEIFLITLNQSENCIFPPIWWLFGNNQLCNQIPDLCSIKIWATKKLRN